jgi:hypothetical protein
MVLANSRISLSAIALALGCNALLGNEEGILAEATGGRSGAGGEGEPPGQSHGGEPASDGGSPPASDGGSPPASGSGGEVSADAGASGSGASAGSADEPPASGGMSDGSGGVNTGGNAAAGGGNAAAAGDAGAGGNSGTGGGAPCACTPGATAEDQVACDPCGTATVTKACQQDCQWSDYGLPGTCVMPTGACVPGTAPQTRVAPCPNGGWKNQTQSCTDACTLGPWVDAGACEYGQNECSGCACVSWCKDEDTGGGTTCLWIACSEAEARTECQADSKSLCGAVNSPLTFKDWRPM